MALFKPVRNGLGCKSSLLRDSRVSIRDRPGDLRHPPALCPILSDRGRSRVVAGMTINRRHRRLPHIPPLTRHR